MPRLNRRGHYKMTSVQETILRQIGRGGNLSVTSLTKSSNRHYSDVKDSVIILQKKGFVTPGATHKGRGRPEKLFILTDKGVEKLIDLKPSLEDFWKLVLFVYDKTTNHNSKLSIDKIFSSYEKGTLGFSKEFSSPIFEWAVENIRDMKKHSRNGVDYEVIYILAERKSMTLNQIIKEIRFHKDAYRADILDDRNPEPFSWMISRYLITKTNSKIPKYQLSPVGLLFVLAHFYTRYKAIEELPLSDEKIKRKIDTTLANYHFLLPRIFDNWYILSKIFKEKALLGIFETILYFYDSPYAQPVQNSGLYELFSDLRSMSRVTLYKLQRELSTGREMLNWWAGEKRRLSGVKITKKKMLEWLADFTKDPAGALNIWDVYAKQLSLAFECFPYKIGREKISDQIIRVTGMHDDKNIQKSIQEYISFQFYSIIVYKIRLFLLVTQHLELNKTVEYSKIYQEQIRIMYSWRHFLKKNRDFRNWYLSWINQILMFGENNLSFLKRMNDLSMESFSLKSEIDKDFMNRLTPSTYFS